MAVGREHVHVDLCLENAIHQTVFLGNLTTPSVLEEHRDRYLFHTKIMGLPFGRLIYFMYLCALYKTV